MRAREFIKEDAARLPPEQADPMRYTYVIPGLSAADPYRNYRFGVAIARARSDAVKDEVNPNLPEWHDETAFGEHGIVAGMVPSVDRIIDAALQMTNTPGGKKLVSTPTSTEPTFVDTVSPIKAFKGYPR
jgi:hypothetical protein